MEIVVALNNWLLTDLYLRQQNDRFEIRYIEVKV